MASCWGANSVGQLGDGTTTYSPSPVAVADNQRFEAVTTVGQHTCALDESGSAFCWGDNSRGQLGDGTTTGRSRPTAVAGGRRFTDLAAGEVHTCGIDQSGAAFCWGWNRNGQLGNGTTTDASTPVPVSGGVRFTKISAGQAHTCAIETAGNVFCWGFNDRGPLGNGIGGDQLMPVPVVGPPTGSGFGPAPKLAQIDAGVQHTCGLDAPGDAYCWGYRGGIGSAGGRFDDAHYAVAVAGGRKYTRITGGSGGQSCAVDTSAAAYCWGANQRGQVGNGTTAAAPAFVETPAAVSGGIRFAQVSAGYIHTCGVDTGGNTYCWSGNDNGQLGDGTINSTVVPVRVGAPGNRRPETPTITVGTVTGSSVALTGSAFRDPDGGDGHTASEWPLDARDGTWTGGSLRTSGITNGDLTTRSFDGLRPTTPYKARVRYRDRSGSFSSFSAPIEFTTPTVPGAVDPAGSFDVLTVNGEAMPVRQQSEFLLLVDWTFRPDGTHQRRQVNLRYQVPVTVNATYTTFGSSGGAYTYVKDTIILNPAGPSAKIPYKPDTLFVSPGTYVRRTGAAPTVDLRVRLAVPRIAESELSMLLYTHRIVSSSRAITARFSRAWWRTGSGGWATPWSATPRSGA